MSLRSYAAGLAAAHRRARARQAVQRSLGPESLQELQSARAREAERDGGHGALPDGTARPHLFDRGLYVPEATTSHDHDQRDVLIAPHRADVADLYRDPDA